MLGTGPLGSTLWYTEKWSVREALGVGEMTFGVGIHQTRIKIGD